MVGRTLGWSEGLSDDNSRQRHTLSFFRILSKVRNIIVEDGSQINVNKEGEEAGKTRNVS